MTFTREIAKGIYEISVPQLFDHPNTAHYLIVGEKTALIEASFPRSLPYMEKALEEVGVGWKDIDYVVATHFHVDHTSAIGAVLQRATRARVLINRRGHKLLTDGARLLRGAQIGFGYLVYKMYGRPGVDVVAVPLDKMILLEGGEEVDLGKGKRLKFVYAPGHEMDHTAVYEVGAKALFPSEAVSVYNSKELRAMLPPASGGVYDLPNARKSIEELMKLDTSLIALPHFGLVEDMSPREFLEKSLYYLDYWYLAVSKLLDKGYNFYYILDYINRNLLEQANYKNVEQLHEYFRKYWFSYLPKLTLMGYINFILQYPPVEYKPRIKLEEVKI